jgi:hypothetical protein
MIDDTEIDADFWEAIEALADDLDGETCEGMLNLLRAFHRAQPPEDPERELPASEWTRELTMANSRWRTGAPTGPAPRRSPTRWPRLKARHGHREAMAAFMSSIGCAATPTGRPRSMNSPRPWWQRHNKGKTELMGQMEDREEILALLDAPTRASFEADAKGDHDELLDLIGMAVYQVNVDGTSEQLAELINRGYQGTDDFMRSVETALAIARGETAEAKAVREAREIEERREFEWRVLGALDTHGDRW